VNCVTQKENVPKTFMQMGTKMLPFIASHKEMVALHMWTSTMYRNTLE